MEMSDTSLALEHPGGIKRDFYLFGKYLKLNLMAALEYKAGFLTIITSIVLTLGVWYVYWSIILGLTGNAFAGWGPQQFVVWYFFTEFSIGIFGLFSAVSQLYFYVIDEGLEPLLSQPFHPLVQILGEGMYILSLVRALFSLLILAIGSFIFGIHLNLLLLLAAIVVSCTGVIIFTAVYVIVETLAFWVGSVEFLVNLLVDVEMNFIRLPQNIISEFLLFSVFVILPVGLFATIPTFLVFNGSIFASLNLLGEAGLFLVLLLFTYIMSYLAYKAFNTGLARYDGVSE